MTQLKRLLCVLLCMVLIAAAALYMVGCNNKKTDTDDSNVKTEASTQVTSPTEKGEGKKQFDFVVVDGEGKETKFVIKTDKETVGEALLDVKLIAGEVQQYGLYVKTVNGITADYDVDQTYWAFYVDGEYASSGVDTTPIEEGKVYSFKVSK